MPKVVVIRHAEADWPNDRLTERGEREAVSIGRERFGGYRTVVCSPKKRSIQTTEAVGFSNYTIDDRLEEFEVDLEAPTVDDYIRLVHSERWNELIDFGDRILEAIAEYGTNDDTLIVAHSAIMSAAFRILTGEIASFPNLGGFEVHVNNGKVERPSKV